MKKIEVLKRSVVGVCAATLLTGLCVAPAFAAATDKTVDTAVTLNTEAAQIDVTVPTNPVAVAVGTDGAFSAVSGGKFVNNSLCGVHIASIAFAKTQGSPMTLLDKTTYTTSSQNNIASLEATVGTNSLDLGTFASSKAPTDSISFGTGVMKDVTYAGSIKNLTTETMGAPALTFVTVTWTVAADTIPVP